MQTEVNVRGCD